MRFGCGHLGLSGFGSRVRSVLGEGTVLGFGHLGLAGGDEARTGGSSWLESGLGFGLGLGFRLGLLFGLGLGLG